MKRALYLIALSFITAVLSSCGGSEISILPVDEYGYVTVQAGQRIKFPIKDEDLDYKLFSVDDYFEIVGILGNQSNQNSVLTDFEQNDIWLLLRSYNPNNPTLFIFELRPDGHSSSFGDDDTQKAIESLKSLFESGNFVSNGNYPRIQPTGLFLYVCGDYGKTYNLKVEASPGKTDQLFAKIFGSKDQGRLVVILKADYDIGIRIIKASEVKFRPELDSVLPKPELNQSSSYNQ